jgi:phosphatidylserine decarboxylase
MVGAILVSGITTVWGGQVVPPDTRDIVRRDWRGWGVRLTRGAEMARFEMGSTVIVLTPSGRLDTALQPESIVRVGQRLGDL